MSNKPFVKLKSLPKDVQGEIDSKLLAGESGLDVARWLQNDCKRFVGEDVHSLKKMLERYRKRDLRKRVAERVFNKTNNLTTNGLVRRISALDEMNDLVALQKERLTLIRAREIEMGGSKILLKDVTREIGVMKSLLVELGRLQLETGWLPKAPKNFRGHVNNADGTVTEFEWTEEQEQLYEDLEAMHAEVRQGSSN